jgi:GntR family transcriptional repressor for pyruvate dehydrogenase complex
VASEAPAVKALLAPIRKTRVHEEIANRIRRLILDGAFPLARSLPSERVLARRFGVSRGSVRDALRSLEMLGLLEMRHGQGTFPRELSVDRLVTPLVSVLTYQRDLQSELIDVRRMFEPAVARVAATRVTGEDLETLERVLDRQRRKLAAGQSTIAEDTEFHAALARATHNRVAVRLMETLNDLLEESRTLTLRQEGRPQRSVEGHEAIVSAMRRGDPDAAERAMHDHSCSRGHPTPQPTPGAACDGFVARRSLSPQAPRSHERRPRVRSGTRRRRQQPFGGDSGQVLAAGVRDRRQRAVGRQQGPLARARLQPGVSRPHDRG